MSFSSLGLPQLKSSSHPETPPFILDLLSAAVNHRFPKPMRNISISLDAVDEWHMRCVVELVVCLTGLSGRVGRHADGLDGGYNVAQRYCEGRI